MNRLVLVSVLLVFVAFTAAAGGSRRNVAAGVLPDESRPVSKNTRSVPAAEPDWTRRTSAVGTFTTLSGFYDYQANGGSNQYIRVNPANGNIHVIMMTSSDSTAGNIEPARRVSYAFSTNSGANWNNFNRVTVPARRAGFPSLDLGKGPIAGLPVVANHTTITGTQSTIFIDSPEGAGAFSEINAPAPLGGDEPIWPFVAGASDGSVVLAASRSTAATVHWTRTTDFSTWPAWAQLVGPTQSGGRNPVQANGTGRVGIVANTSNGTAALGNWWTESTDNGATWSAPVNIFGQRFAGTDTINSYVHTDFVYNGDTPVFCFSEYVLNVGRVDEDIAFWSQATGFRIAVPFDSTKYFVDPVGQNFMGTRMNYPSIGMSGSTIVIAYQAFQPDTDHLGYAFSDLWYVASSNGGTSWGSPQRITNTPNVDEKYPSISKWNAPGEFNLVWTQKSGSSGLFAFPGGADTVRASQVFLRVNPIVFGGTAVDGNGNGVANSFRLSQNYPNPFNPATKIEYTVAQAGPVTIKVYNTVGQEVATVLNENLAPGTYQATFNGSNLASGVYIYKMTAGSFVESKKMVLMK